MEDRVGFPVSIMRPVVLCLMLLMTATAVYGWSSKKVCTQREVAWHGRRCVSDADCPPGVNAVCLHSRCGCRPVYLYSADNDTCIQEPWLGQRECTSNADCPAGSNAVCPDNKCLCHAGVFFSTGRNTCVQSCAESERVSTFTEYGGYLYSGGPRLFAKSPSSVQQCLETCVNTTSCVAVNSPGQGGEDCEGYSDTVISGQVKLSAIGFTNFFMRQCA